MISWIDFPNTNTFARSANPVDIETIGIEVIAKTMEGRRGDRQLYLPRQERGLRRRHHRRQLLCPKLREPSDHSRRDLDAE